MTANENAFLERAAVQMLFVSGREFSLEALRDKLRELFVLEPDATMRAAASGGSFELMQSLLQRLPHFDAFAADDDGRMVRHRD